MSGHMNHPTDFWQKGFTLIELIMVIVILGILAATAIPKYVDFTSEAEIAAANGVYAAAQSAANINFASSRVGKAGIVPISNGTTLLTAMDGTPDGWSVSGQSLRNVGKAATYTITVGTPESTSARAVLIKSW